MLNPQQGDITVNEYEAEFRILSHFVVTYMPYEIRKCRKFENGLRDEIRSSLVSSLFNEYNKYVESARTMKLTKT